MAVIQEYETEALSAAAFDEVIEWTNLFTSFPEVRGTLIQPRPGQVDKSVRIDRVLIPKQRLLDAGWGHGIIGVEIKRSAVKMGPPIAQAMDYARSVWTLPHNYQVMLSWVFIWPMPTDTYGPLASILAQHRVGCATSDYWTRLQLKCGNNILRVSHDGTIRIGTGTNGVKAGSR